MTQKKVRAQDINATGTPDGTTFLRGDNTWSAPASVTGTPTVEITGTSQTAITNTTYITNNSSMITITLPVTSDIGDKVIIIGKGSGVWKIAQNTGQNIKNGNSSTTVGTGGYLISEFGYDTTILTCITANTTWRIIPNKSFPTFV